MKVRRKLNEIENDVMQGLKDFQRATVERIDYLYSKKGQKRILVSDEVGLGKTLVARGAVAKMAKLRKKEGDDIFRVVYICSNAAIADQNLQKLRITEQAKVEETSYSRLSMQHLNIYMQECDSEIYDSYIQLIPLTPETSFRIATKRGVVGERALIFAILRHVKELKPYLRELETELKNIATSSWDRVFSDYNYKVEQCDAKSNGRYIKEMVRAVNAELKKEFEPQKTYLDFLRERCLAIRKNKGRRVIGNELTEKLRFIFARISVEKLNPDFVIMDEFQRFKYLLDSNPETEIGMLREKFFNSPEVRVLLLSATPYKMYSTMEEIDEDPDNDHYKEFRRVMNFLDSDSENAFFPVWKDYSVLLSEYSEGNTTIIEAKRRAEAAMYRSVCRTERCSDPISADMINDEDVYSTLDVKEDDICSYLDAREVVGLINNESQLPIDYVKSTPYLLSFMKDYELKRKIERYYKKHVDKIDDLDRDSLWLDTDTLDDYEKIPCNNARLERVMDQVLIKGMEMLLWIPPSKQYYEPGGVYKSIGDNISKTLIFSSWEMVPRMIACMMSYEAERRTVGKIQFEHGENISYCSDRKKRYPYARLSFKLNNKTPAAMSLFCLIYPSIYLAKCYSPISCLNEHKSINEIKSEIKKKIAKKLDRYPKPLKGKADKQWYYLAPLLLDSMYDREYVDEWLDELGSLENDEIVDTDDEDKGFRYHVKNLKKTFQQALNSNAANLGPRPKDLLDVLSLMAVASPAVCIYRTYERYYTEDSERNIEYPTRFAKAFINKMNTPESTAVVDLACDLSLADDEQDSPESAHWKKVLLYNQNGNIQAMLDEYAHMLASGCESDSGRVYHIHKEIMSGIEIRTTPYSVDSFDAFRNRMERKEKRIRSLNMRTHYAVAFNKGDGQDKDKDRKRIVRNAFNSPFRPFVLASTSIGQEGLDFHYYCRKIVHWNLPSNPIDLEQREGRINRYECLAIRQTVAKRYGNKKKFKNDIWDEMFKLAEKGEKRAGSSDLLPYWGLRDGKDMVKIERIVPMYPFSRDELTYERLIKIVSLYRLTLGQARQEELLEYIFKNVDDTETLKELFLNLSPFYRNKE